MLNDSNSNSTRFTSDIDECIDGTHGCDVNAECNNTQGSYNCTCKDGFHGNDTNCTGECSYLSTGHVQMAAKTLVARICEMNFIPIIFTVVIDIDECIDGTYRCDVNAECNNTLGSYNCTCKDGFHGNGTNCTG